MTPTEYLAALKREKVSGPRIWVNASVFETEGQDGQEQLSPSGRLQIDDLVASTIAELPGSVIVVEGYSTITAPDEQFTTSRRRADLVRRYLELHFHLRSSDIGIVPLLVPPEGSGRDAWNGAAMMVIQKKGKQS